MMLPECFWLRRAVGIRRLAQSCRSVEDEGQHRRVACRHGDNVLYLLDIEQQSESPKNHGSEDNEEWRYPRCDVVTRIKEKCGENDEERWNKDEDVGDRDVRNPF